MTNFTFKSGLVLLSLSALVACGKDSFRRQSDPLVNYPDFQKDVRAEDYKTSSQQFVSGEIFSLKVDDRVDSSTHLDFYLRQQGSYQLRARSSIPGLQFTLVARDLPQGATLTKSPGAGANYVLSWTPSASVIPVGERRKKLQAKIDFVVDQRTAHFADGIVDLSATNLTRALTLNVEFPETRPVIEVSGLEVKEIKHGSLVPFKVRIKDPNGSEKVEPYLLFSYPRENASNEIKAFPLQAAILDQDVNPNPKYIGNGTWEFSKLLDTTLLKGEKIFDPRSMYQSGEMILVGISGVTKQESVSKLISIKVRPADQKQAVEATKPEKIPKTDAVKDARK